MTSFNLTDLRFKASRNRVHICYGFQTQRWDAAAAAAALMPRPSFRRTSCLETTVVTCV